MISVQILFFLLLFSKLLHAIPMDKHTDHRMHREQSQEIDETVEWDKLQPLTEIPTDDLNKLIMSSTSSQLSFHPDTIAVPATGTKAKELKQIRNVSI